jgi:hypothetical protein
MTSGLDRRTVDPGRRRAPTSGQVQGQSQSVKRFVTANNGSYDTLNPHVVFDIDRIATRLDMYDCLVRWVGNAGDRREQSYPGASAWLRPIGKTPTPARVRVPPSFV